MFCGSSLRPFFRTRDHLRDGDPVLHTVGWCSRCHYGGVEGSFDAASVAEFYNVPSYYTHDDTWRPDPPEGFWERARAHLAWRADRGTDLDPAEGVGTTLLDIGCGAGTNLARFAAQGYASTGVEPDDVARQLASRHGEIYPGTAEMLPDEVLDQSYDTVLLSHVLEHCIDPKAALLNVRKVLSPAGRVIIEVPNNAAAGFRTYKQSWPAADVPRHLHFFTRWSLHELLRQCGFKVQETIYVGYYRQLHPYWITTQRQISGRVGGRPPMGTMESWLFLLRTGLSPRDSKYDSIRVHAGPA